MSTLADRLRERIQREGPIPFYDWMKTALYDPEHGYYCRSDRERWGRAGDYRTSPEQSILFSATFARYFAKLHTALDSPDAWTIVECGAGAGYFAESVLLTLQERFPDVFRATRYVIDEVSRNSRFQISDRLRRFAAKVELTQLEEIEPLNPAIVFANELLDAFPVHRIVMGKGELLEFYVGVNKSGSFEWEIGKLSEQLDKNLAHLDIQLREGQIAEINPGIEQWLELVSRKIRKGYLVIVDYGAQASDLYDPGARPNGTLRAFHRHRLAEDLLMNPGEQDLTSSINWMLVKTLATKTGFKVAAFERQDKFLLGAGLLDEMELRVTLAQSETEKVSLRAEAREMILPGGMAESFQVLVAEKR